jgi:hypothetical protein
MEFHLPFFALRGVTTPDDTTPKPNPKSLRCWDSITIMTREKWIPEAQHNYRLCRAKISCVVHGLDEWQWTTWAFEDTEYEMGVNDHMSNHNGASGDEKTTCDAFKEDPITCGLDADMPIWKPRQYFLKAFEVRIIKVREEWDRLVHKLELDRKENVRLVDFDFFFT